MRLVGAVYLVWLCVSHIRRALDHTAGTEAPEVPGGTRAFLVGLTTNLLNPKVGVFYLAVVPLIVGLSRVHRRSSVDCVGAST